MRRFLTIVAALVAVFMANAQNFQQIDPNGNGMMNGNGTTNRNFNKHNNDTTKNKEVPKGLRVWTIDRRFGDVFAATPDTLQHLFMNSIFNTGKYGEYNTIGNNYSPRINRIVIDRPLTDQFAFVQPYDYVTFQPDTYHFTNTLSPLTNIKYDNCGNKTNGEDHIDAKFSVNANKRLGVGFDLNYSYARGFYANQSTSHFGALLYGSYDGDRYKMHTMFSTYHRKAAENGGLTSDEYVTKPEIFEDQFATDEMPTVLSQNWNRNNSIHFFLTHRYSVGFYRDVKMTEEEIKARKFAEQSKKENDARKQAEASGEKNDNTKNQRKKNEADNAPKGRPEGAKIAGDEPANVEAATDTTRIKVNDQAAMDSLLAAKAVEDSIAATMKKEYVPVTSFIHTFDLNNYDHIYQAYQSPTGYYADTYYDLNADNAYAGDSIYDQTKLTQMKNTFAIAMLEGFNKWVKAGLKVFATHELRKFSMPDIVNGTTEDDKMVVMGNWNENNVSIGGQLIKSQGRTLHYNLSAETWLVGEDAGQLKVDFSTDVNFRLLGDTVTLAAKAYFYNLHPTFYHRHYHSKHLWWDNSQLSKETRTRVEGLFTYRKTNTRLRVAVEEIQNYTYLGINYDKSSTGMTGMTASVEQCGSNINLITAQLMQDFKLGPLHWENVLTYQNCNQQDVLPVPSLNLFTNLYLKFKIAGVLSVDLGADATFFTKYYAPDYSPQLSQYAIQKNEASRVELGGYPFVDVYANMHLKHTRFFIMYSHVNAGSGNRMQFLAPHYAQNNSILRFGLSWNFFN
ncbi:MAG: hypothetical protein PUD51_00815 [Prevotellaceae bacterium]|nr:hypothetical protein [Prevotellaceae bacterium]